ncbi:MAG: hypothetical protein AUK47_12480 [Deltaproteobacteria bacterium CG2_30_63_29]|nr:MAG: hypothetical protein AUK47_12480 [Deltaproteobacteria bacterium CG2_30_63_29]PIW02692.1 MAG: hypothetical protein COW42_00290 [Deltaproteobacteria bacterium CG17_big_fil_post_rev_8_21_14_2_50_63_7]PJB39037.1 MAG: hypothetical protein CO108_17990 [Deltaproteobacteria bacterium CG_4_9_14_3_um_filter_63_12]
MTPRRKKRLVFAGLLLSLLGWLMLQSYASELEYERYTRQMLVFDEVETHVISVDGAPTQTRDEQTANLETALFPALGYVSACFVKGNGSTAPVEMELLVAADLSVNVRGLEPQDLDETCVREALEHSDWDRVKLPLAARVRLVALASK